MNTGKLTIEQSIDETNSAYVVGWNDDVNDYTIEELKTSDSWVGGDSGGWTSDSNIYFTTLAEFEYYLNREYKNHIVFSEENERTDWLEENTGF